MEAEQLSRDYGPHTFTVVLIRDVSWFVPEVSEVRITRIRSRCGQRLLQFRRNSAVSDANRGTSDYGLVSVNAVTQNAP